MKSTTSLAIGTTILSVWSILNILPAAWSIVYILLGKHAPAFTYLFTQSEILTLDTRVLATTDCVALLLNTLIISFCIIVLCVIHYELKNSKKWSFWVLFISISMIQKSAFIADSYLGNPNLLANLFSTLLVIVSFACVAYAMFWTRKNK
jgi:hypothetical protein